MKRLFLVVCAAILLSGIVLADEGMWPYGPPAAAKAVKARVAAKYKFNLTDQWLDHVRLSSVRFNNGGSGSFVSADGLTFTNHHVAQTCLHGLSTEQKDLYKLGFYAKTRAEEAKCPDLELNVLQGIEDVTAKVNAGITPNMPAAEAGTMQRKNRNQIEADCNKSTGLRCDIVTLYSGAVYNLYKYKKYTDVRLVFAPEFTIAFFGGDPDNFEYPRYDLDITYFRVYENDKPVHLDNYLKWSPNGVTDNELIFVSGHPGSTGRLLTMAQMDFQRDFTFPNLLKSLARRVQVLQNYASKSEENNRRAQEMIFGIQNSQKAVKGYDSGLHDKSLMAKKQAEENKYKQAVAADPKKKAEFGDPWAEIAKSQDVYKKIYLPVTYYERTAGLRSQLAGYARALVRVADERVKPNAERLPEFSESRMPSLEMSLLAPTPVYKDMDEVLLADSLSEWQETMPQDKYLTQILNGRTPAQAAHDLIEKSGLADPAVRKQLWDGGKAAIDASTDPLIQAMRLIDPEARKYRKTYDDEVASVETINGAKIGKLRFATSGYNVAPDATFTLRLSYGVTKGYTEDGRGIVPAGTKLPYFTTMGGAFDWANKHGNKDPYALPPTWEKAKSKINLNTPMNVVETADIIGGNSGSPVVNKKAEVVGIIFDGNIQSLPWRFAYEDVIGRSVQVDSRGIIEALRNIYDATELANELAGPAKPAVKKTTTNHKPAKKVTANTVKK